MNRVSIIIPTYKRVNLLRQILQNLVCQEYIHEILIIDSKSNDGTKELINSYDSKSDISIKHFNVDNNVSLKRNTGIKKSSSNYLIFIDDDCIPSKEFVKNHIESLDFNENSINCGNVFFPISNVNSSNYIRFKNSRHINYRYMGPNDKELDYTTIVTMNMSIKKNDILKYNLFFNEEFIGYGMEDNEYGLQIMNAGLKIKTCPASIEHMEGNDPFLFASKIYHTARDGVYKFKILNKKAVMNFRYSYFFEPDYAHKSKATKYLVKFIRLFFSVFIAKKLLKILDYFDKCKALYFPILYKFIFAAYYYNGVKNRGSAYVNVDEVSKSWYSGDH
jgi:glycosyltransferase involved in cell wall biosynthesis